MRRFRNGNRIELPQERRVEQVKFLLAVAVFGATAAPATVHADCEFPPLNANKEEYSQTEHVRGVPFTSRYFSWHLPSYHIAGLQCSQSIHSGPLHWSLVIGAEGQANTELNSGEKSKAPVIAPLAALPALPALPINSATALPLSPLGKIPQALPPLAPLE